MKLVFALLFWILITSSYMVDAAHEEVAMPLAAVIGHMKSAEKVAMPLGPFIEHMKADDEIALATYEGYEWLNDGESETRNVMEPSTEDKKTKCYESLYKIVKKSNPYPYYACQKEHIFCCDYDNVYTYPKDPTMAYRASTGPDPEKLFEDATSYMKTHFKPKPPFGRSNGAKAFDHACPTLKDEEMKKHFSDKNYEMFFKNIYDVNYAFYLQQNNIKYADREKLTDAQLKLLESTFKEFKEKYESTECFDFLHQLID